MAGGYFNDGTVNIEIGAHAFATPSTKRRNLALNAAGLSSVLLDEGGGSVTLSVTGQRLRANLGDAERWMYEVCRVLATSGPGALGFEDQLGNRATFGQAVCIRAAGVVQAWTFADMSFHFLVPEKVTEPAWASVPEAPGTYAGTDTLIDYAAGGVPIGTNPAAMAIEMLRQYPLREVPRARGARSRGPARGAQIRFTVSSHAVVAGTHLAAYLEGLARQIGPRPVPLTANGNTYADVILESLAPKHTDHRTTTIQVEFLQQVG